MRKVLSFVLILSLVLGSFSMAFAADSSAGLSDVSGNANVDAIKVAYDLEIVTGNPDGTFQPEKAVNRAEFAAMITRALAIPESALAGYTTTSFKDTTGYGWAVPYLAFCQSKGIMLGDGYGNAMPGRTISVNEAMTMALRAVGYTANSSLLVGAWPANYVSLAQNNELYDKVVSAATVDKANAAQIIYNLLTVQKVAVNADGKTEFQTTKINGSTVEANLLNTNLGAEEKKDLVLGQDYDYDNSLINITENLGAFGTAYVNDDDELIAFTVKSTALTGKMDGAKFKVGDTKYDLPGTATISALFANTDKDGSTYGAIGAKIASYAAVNADGGTTVTINADVSGKNIKEVYSVVAWKADDADLAASDVQEDIEDQELLGFDFALNDDDEIDFNSFQLVGVASLDKIAKDDVVYIYADGSNDIRKIAVGTETVEGVIDEVGSDFVTIGGKDYEFPASGLINAAKVADFDVDDEGIFYLDYEGNIFDFEGTTGTTDTYAIVKAGQDESSFDNMKLKLYLSDDSTKTLYLEDSADDISWTTKAGMDLNAATTAAMRTGELIAYSLNSDGEIDAVDVTASVGALYFQSTKIASMGGVSFDVDSDAVVFTYKTTTTAIGDYDIAALADINKGLLGSPAAIILNSDGDIAAFFVSETDVDVDDDDVYGVFNTRTSAKNGDDTIYKFTGFIDGVAFTKTTDDRDSNFTGKAEAFGVYKITVDANDVITDVVDIENNVTLKKTGVKGISGNILGANTSGIITDTNSDKTVIKIGTAQYTIAEDAIVYKYDDADNEFSVSKLSALRKNYTVSLYDTKGDDANGIASVVIYIED